MDEQLTLRISRELADSLSRLADDRGTTRSQLVREAVAAYVAAPDDAETTWRQLLPFVGSVELERGERKQDDVSQLIRDHNWRD